MKRLVVSAARAWPALFLVLLLHACETFPPPGEPPAGAAVAEQAERRGEYVLAAREYERLAHSAKAPHKQNLQLRGVEALIKAGQAPEARQKLASIKTAGLDAGFGIRKRVIDAKLLVLEGAHEKALRQLDDIARARGLDPALLADIERARAQAELAVGNPFGAVRNLVRREQYLAAREAVADNQLQIWKILSGQPRLRLATELNLTRDPVAAGWIELTLAVTENAAPAGRLAGAIENWKKTHPAHPAGESLLATLRAGAPVAARARSVALLLPLTSSVASAAQAVRDGFLAMESANANPDKPQVKLYDIGADPAKAPEFYAQAVKDGAQVIVGPLGREAGEQILRGASIAVPTLLLSQLDETGNRGGKPLYQFGLPPEQEAKQVAERAWLDGHRRAAVLYPQSSYGERMHAAFMRHWQRLGGAVAASQAYRENLSDYSEPIKQLLNIHLSETRKADIERRVGQKIQFEARARQDIDFIFLAADAPRGRLIKPQLSFYHAARVPVYATSLIYTGRADPVRDTDLDGVLFADMPWILLGEGRIQELRQNLQRDWPYAYSDLDRLYALGMDSYAILPYLHRIGADGGRFSGVTSQLTLDAEGRVQRRPLWARFSKGTPRLIDSTPSDAGQFRLDLPGG
ncbi:MAG: penicillin-binding protein activator [Gammaproteobacteria bacterium]|nr:penicillin-binding protein activator [Gammaproteobacteria bacterium]